MGMRLPRMSTWDMKPTPLNSVLRYKDDAKTSKCILVDKDLAQTYVGEEELVGVDPDRKDSCASDEGGTLRQPLTEFIQRCLQEDRERDDDFDGLYSMTNNLHFRRRTRPIELTK